MPHDHSPDTRKELICCEWLGEGGNVSEEAIRVGQGLTYVQDRQPRLLVANQPDKLAAGYFANPRVGDQEVRVRDYERQLARRLTIVSSEDTVTGVAKGSD